MPWKGALVLCRGDRVEPQDLPATLRRPGGAPDRREATGEPSSTGSDPPATGGGPGVLPLKEVLLQAEKEYILHALEVHGWNRSQAARALAIDRTTLFHKMRRHGLQPTQPGQSGTIKTSRRRQGG